MHIYSACNCDVSKLFVQLIQLRQELQIPSVLRRLVAGVLGRRVSAYVGAQKYVPAWRRMSSGFYLCVLLRELLLAWAPRLNRDTSTDPDPLNKGDNVSQEFVAN